MALVVQEDRTLTSMLVQIQPGPIFVRRCIHESCCYLLSWYINFSVGLLYHSIGFCTPVVFVLWWN